MINDPTPTAGQVMLIENNLLLKQAIKTLEQVKAAQEVNHLVSIQLRDHDTIERVDTLWTNMGQIRFLVRIIAGGMGLLLGGGGLLGVTHVIFNWPL